MPEFVHLHSHTCFSLLDGLARIDDLLTSAVDQRMPALALTDHGTMFAAIEFYKKAREKEVKPIIGCEVYVSDRPLEERPGPGAKNYHLVLLAENETGYRNLIQLTTEAHLRGFYRKPRIDHALLEQHSEGLVCLSACASGEVADRILKGDTAGAEQMADWYRQIFPGRYYLELQDHSLDIDPKINDGVLDLSRRLGLPLLATNDVHYVQANHARAHEILLCIQTQTTMSDPKRMRLDTQEFYLKSPEQMHALFGHVPEALANTLAVAERCSLELSFGRPHFPAIETPVGRSSSQHLRILCEEGLVRRYPDLSSTVRDRLDHELSTIETTGFVDYFLLVYDVIHYARSQGIAVGPGRGSAVGSLVTYSLFLTNVDPIANDLSFDRFLNLERVSMPDMDLDFADDRREEVIRYVSEKWGRERVAQIITFGTIGPRAGVRDVGRVMGMTPSEVDRVAKLIPLMCTKVSKAKEDVPEIQQIYDNDPAMKEVLDLVEDLEGVARHASTHAAGIVIARDPLRDLVPLYKVPKNDQIITQYAMASIEHIGLLKMDLLGLRTLTILERTCGFVAETTGTPLTTDDLPLDDPSIYQLLSAGDTFGVFQVDGPGMRKFITQLRPTEFKHVIALLALYRPGPMDYIEEFAARKNGERPVRYDHPALEEVLKETYGIVVYQEQVMKLAVLVAGYTMGEGDLLRRAMGKKKPEELAKHRTAFIDRAEQLGTGRDVAAHLFNVIEPFAGYAFNKSHSAAYAVITCQTAYLKANYPREYLAGFLSAERENSDKVAEAMAECRRLGVGILPPDVNRSEVDFTLENEGIRFGLSAIKHVGEGAIQSLLAERRAGGAFASLEDFCSRVDWMVVSKRVLESLARCGALDSLQVERGRILGNLDRLVGFGDDARKAAAAGQASLFGDIEQPPIELRLVGAAASTLEERLTWEQELLGIAITRHPVIDAEADFRAVKALPVSAVTSEHNNQNVSIGGLVRKVRTISTKAGQPMAKFVLTDLVSSIEAVVFSRNYERMQGKLQDGALIVVEGRLDANDGPVNLLVDGVFTLDEARERPVPGNGNGRKPNRNGWNGNGSGNHSEQSGAASPPLFSGPVRRITIEVERGNDRNADVDRIVAVYQAVQRFPGQDEVEIVLRHQGRLQSIPLPNRRAGCCDPLLAEIGRLLAPDAVHVTSPGVVS